MNTQNGNQVQKLMTRMLSQSLEMELSGTENFRRQMELQCKNIELYLGHSELTHGNKKPHRSCQVFDHQLKY
jgi:hypothetical protein